MPSISSIRYLSDDSECSQRPPLETVDLWRKRAKNPDVFSIFALATKFDIPSLDILALGVRGPDGILNNRGTAYSLGSGVSCSVTLHEMKENIIDSIDNFPSGVYLDLFN